MSLVNSKLPKIIVILGPTASGKTEVGIRLAKNFQGEVVSADSRQIYKKMDIGTAKPVGEWRRDLTPPSPLWRRGGGRDRPTYLVDGVPHHLMDIVDPGEDFSLAEYKERAITRINDILKRGKLPIIVGGTGLYIWAIVDNLNIPKVAPNKKLRQSLEKKPLEELVEMLKKFDSHSAEKIDLKNPRRVLRALEVAILSGDSFAGQQTKSPPLWQALQIGISWPKEVLKQRIEARCDEQIKAGLLEETKALVQQKYGWQLPSMSGIGYKEMGMFLQGDVSWEEAVALFKRNTWHYAKRQMTWFRRDQRIRWVEGEKVERTEYLVKNFIRTKK